ncbi:MAG: dihydroorotase [Oscillospiraceae bacterium]|nr:dihydroorotase [Oscillospiraceae bacterium]
MTILIKNAKIVDPANKLKIYGDILIANGVIEKVGADIVCDADRVINADGMTAMPGLVDMHVHLRDPGQEYKEDIITGCEAAACGGVTCLAAMPNTSPTSDNVEIIQYILNKAQSANSRVYPVAAITKGLKGEELTDFAELKKTGVIAFTDDGRPVESASVMRNALFLAQKVGSLILSHSEDLTLAGGIMNEGVVSQNLVVKATPNAAEDVAVAREIALSASTSCPMHICHVSSKNALKLIRTAKNDGVQVTCETGPHYFTFTDEQLYKRDADFRMNPPLRAEEDRQELLKAIADGTIDAIATDHAPHSPEDKADFEKAPNGVVGMQTSLSASYTALVKSNLISMDRLVELMCLNPAKILKLPYGTLSVGAPADMVLFDENAEWVVRTEELAGKSHNTPFKNMKLYGKVVATVCRGEIVFDSLK